MPKVFVVGALLPMGGAYMAYHVGRLLSLYFGYELFDVAVSKPEKQIFHYDTPIKTVNMGQLEKMMTGDDLLIANPSYSQFLFGLRLPGRKIMYAQGLRTSSMVDCHFDLYVSVSQVVSRYLYALYGISAPVIPAFIQLSRMPQTELWQERPKGSALVYIKATTHEHKLIYDELVEKLKHTLPSADLSHRLEGRKLGYQEFLKAIGSVRYFVNISLEEGFGLVPLEAMALGTTVTGLDGLAGRDYMRSGQNCLVSSVTNLRNVTEVVSQAFSDETLAAQCAAAGQMTARQYGYPPFKAAWIKQLAGFLQVEPDGKT